MRARGDYSVQRQSWKSRILHGVKIRGESHYCVTNVVPASNCQVIKDLCAELVAVSKDADEAMACADKLYTEHGMSMIHPFDDIDNFIGQGTISLELAEARLQLGTATIHCLEVG